MKKILRKFSLGLIVFQLLSLPFFEQAFLRFYYFLNGDLYTCILRSTPETVGRCMETYGGPDLTLGKLISQPVHFHLYGLCFGILLTIVLNLLKKVSFWNSVVVVLLYLLLFFIGAFKYRLLDKAFFSFGAVFSSGFGTASLIASQVALVIGFLLVWLSLKNRNNKKITLNPIQ